MNIRDALREGALLLEKEDTPFLDASVLLAHTLKYSREKLLASYPDALSETDYSNYHAFLGERLQGVPVAYLTGEKEFYGRSFLVDRRVLIPRPDTEILVETALDVISLLRNESPVLAGPRNLRLLDVCTGTGCIPLTLALEDGTLDAHASDISSAVREVFLINKKRLGSPKVEFHQSDLLKDIPGQWHIITSNPPYLTIIEVEEMESRNWAEPSLALLGGKNGLDLIERLVEESKDSLIKNGYLILEAASVQMTAIRSVLEAAGFREIEVFPDLAGRDRVIRGKLSGA